MGAQHDEGGIYPGCAYSKKGRHQMRMFPALKYMLENCGSRTICFFTNGYISRLGFLAKNRDENFYMVGSMGLVASVALGVALNTARKVIIFDGDGSILMNMGIMPLIGNEKPRNIVHILLDNKTYSSTGNQPTISPSVKFNAVAKSVGYRTIFKAKDLRALKKIYKKAKEKKGPVFIHIAVNTEKSEPVSRVNIVPDNISRRIKRILSSDHH